ncbi:putative Ufm1-specific protease 2 [Operophtera brumata]|uniref:Putative Ufm1-specific protease 2 n=1 Tax=Operophtera brumata TaxID=104452 RepID=A0A0L7KZU2_OPEBR|nr:putative Ufm1-specific protease 2 [Operophtera brumata]
MIHRSTKLLDLYTVLVEAACRSLRLLESVLLEQLGECIIRFCIKMPLRIDTLAMIHRSTKLLDLYTVLVEAACRSLRLLESVLLEQLGKCIIRFCIKMPLRIDTLAMIHRSTKLLDLYTVLVEAACRSLRLLESVLLEQLGQEGIGDGAGLRLPETFHYLPQELGHFITRVVPKAIPDESMGKFRNSYYRPIFRRGNAHIDKTGGKLVNPHEAVPSQARPDVTVAVVRGRYTYHHYMQDSFNDDGWGLSRHYRRQAVLVRGLAAVDRLHGGDVLPGDAAGRHVEDRLRQHWPGAAELCAGVGGGVLAHTILGIEYNTVTHETRYLILDPHYTGAEELATVVGKGWCGWKGADFWKKTAHYNLCLPQTKPAV